MLYKRRKGKRYGVFCIIIMACLLISGCSVDKTNKEDGMGDKVQTDQEDDTGNHAKEDTGQKGEEESFEKLENYRETEVALDPRIKENREEHKAMLTNSEGVIEHYTVSDDESSSESFIWKYSLDANDCWVREPVSWLEGLKEEVDQKRITVLLGEDGNYYAHYVAANEQSHLVKKERDGYTEIDIRDWDITPEREYYMIPDKVAVLVNGNIVMASRAKICYVYDKEDGEIIDTFQCAWFTGLEVKGNLIMILSLDKKSFLVYDAEKKEIVHTITGEFVGSTITCKDDTYLYACDSKGIFKAFASMDAFISDKQTNDDWNRYHFSENFGMILEPQLFKFAQNISMAQELFIVEDCFYVLYTGNGLRLMKYGPFTPVEGDGSELTIYSLKDNAAIRDTITEFRLKYPEINIIYECGDVSGGSTTISDSIRILNARIMAGEGPDLFVLDGLPVSSYIEKGILEDLSDTIRDVKEELHPNIIKAYTQEDKLYALPIRFAVPMFVTAGQSADAITSLKDFVAYSEASDHGIMCEMTYEDALYQLYHTYTPQVIEDESINEKNIKEFLELVKRFCESEKVQEYIEDGYQSTDRAAFAQGETEVIFETIWGMYDLSDWPDFASQREGTLAANKDLFIPHGLLGINHHSSVKETAALFVKEAVSYEVQEKNSNATFEGFPVNLLVLDSHAEKDLSDYIFAVSYTESSGMYATRYFNHKDAEEMVAIAKNASTPCVPDQTIYQIILDESLPYLKGKKSMDGILPIIINRIELYLYER